MKLVANVIGGIALAGVVFYGGTKYQQYRDSLRPYEIIEKEGACLFIDKKESAEIPAEKISGNYRILEEKIKESKEYASQLEKAKGELLSIRNNLNSLEKVVAGNGKDK